MNTTKKERNNFSYYLLIPFCLLLCLAVGPCDAIIEIMVICDKCESENIAISILTVNNQEFIATETLKGCGLQTITLPSSYIGELVYIAANCDEDASGGWSIGDYMVFSGSFEIEPVTTIDININREITAAIRGEVSCDVHDSGLIWVAAYDRPCGSESPCSVIGTTKPFDLNQRNDYWLFLYDVPRESEVYVGGYWDKDKSGDLTECDYGGWFVDDEGNPTPISLNEEVITGINFDTCQFQFPPCTE